MNVEIYSVGLCYASVCAPADMSAEVVAHAVNQQHPTGIGSQWQVADEPFGNGAPNPSPCNDNPERQHWLLAC